MDFSNQFPVLNKYTYLNTAGSGILSHDITDWRTAHDQDFLLTGSIFRLKKDEYIETGRSAIAQFFNSHANRTYLVPNFSCGFNTFLEGLDGPKRFLLLKEDYPSVNYPVESRGHQCTYVPIDAQLEQNILQAIERFNPDILALSLVQYSSGIKMDLDFLKQLKVDHPNLLIIADGTQFCGTAPFDFENSGIDVIISSGYKWLLSGYGNGFVLLSEKAAGMIYTHQKKAALPTEGFLKDRNTLSLYFEPGHLDTLNFGTLFKAITYLQEQGIQNIQDNISQLATTAKRAFIERDLLSAEVKHRKNHSSIFNLLLPLPKITELQANDVIFTYRGTGARVSFHFYNSENDLDKLLQIIDR